MIRPPYPGFEGFMKFKVQRSFFFLQGVDCGDGGEGAKSLEQLGKLVPKV